MISTMSTSTTRAMVTSRVTNKVPAGLKAAPNTVAALVVPAVLDLEDLRVDSKDSSSTTRVALEALAAPDNTRVDTAVPVVLREEYV